MRKLSKDEPRRPASGWRGRGPEPAWFAGWIARRRAEGQRIADAIDARASSARSQRTHKAVMLTDMEAPPRTAS